MTTPEDEVRIIGICSRHLAKLPRSGAKRVSAYLAGLYSDTMKTADDVLGPGPNIESEHDEAEPENDDPAQGEAIQSELPSMPVNGEVVERRA